MSKRKAFYFPFNSGVILETGSNKMPRTFACITLHQFLGANGTGILTQAQRR